MNPSPSPAAPASWKTRLVIAASLMTGVLGSTIPTPLYPLYQAQLNLPSFTTTAIFFAYVIGVLCALLVGGRLTDKIRDRRKLMLPALALVATGMSLLALAHGLAMLLVGRLLAGLGTGVLTGAANATLLDLEPPEHRQRAALLGTTAFTLGGILGPIVSGLALQTDFYPMVAPFLAIIAVAALTSYGVWRLPLHRHGAAASAGLAAPATAPPAVSKEQTLRLMLLSCATLFIVWGVGSSLMALGPSLGEKLLGIHDYAVGGYASSVLAACAGMTQFFSLRVTSITAYRRGCATLAVGLACAVLSLLFKQAWLMGVAVFITGLGFGATFIGAAGIVNQIAPPQLRGRMVSLFYIAGYVGNGWPMVLGWITDHAGPMTAAMTLLATAILAMPVCILLSKKLLPARAR